MGDQADKLRELIRAAEPTEIFAECAPAVVVVSGGRAGVGATTATLNLAAVLVDRGDKVLAIDAAGQRSSMRDVAGVRREWTHGLEDVIAGKCTIGEAIIPGPAGTALVLANGRALPPRRCELLSRRNLNRKEPPTWEYSRQAYQRLMDELRSVETEFDVVIVDGGCGMSAWVQRLWSRAGLVVLVTTPDDAAVLDAYATLKHATAEAAKWPVRLLVNQAENDTIARATHRRMDASCQRFLSRTLPALPALPRHLAIEFVDSPPPPRVWEMPNTPFGHAAMWLGKSVGELVLSEEMGCRGLGDRVAASSSAGATDYARV